MNCFSFFSSPSVPFQQQRWSMGIHQWTFVIESTDFMSLPLSHEREHMFLFKSNNCCFCNMSSCAWEFTPMRGLNFPHTLQLFHYWALQTFLSCSYALRILLLSSSLPGIQLALVNCFSQLFLHVPHEARLFSLLLNDRCALGLGLWRLWRLTWMQHLAADDGRHEKQKNLLDGLVDSQRCKI